MDHMIEILRGEGNISFAFRGLFQDAKKIAEWIQLGSNYTVILDNVPLPAQKEQGKA